MPLFHQDEYDTAPITVAVLHHPEGWFEARDCTAYDNRPNTYAYLAARSHIILSGHTHGAIERSTRCYDRSPPRNSRAYRNNFSILRIDPDKRAVTGRPFEFEPRKPEWEEKEEQHYSLRTERLARGAG